MKRITLVTDAWAPQVNGVVTTLTQLTNQLKKQGIQIDIIQPNDYRFIPMPTYPEIPLVWSAKGLKQRILDFNPDAIHIATEGGLGWKVRRICLNNNLPFTTAYHTKYPEYIHARFPIPESWVYRLFRHFHQPAVRTFVPAESIKTELESKRFNDVVLMSRGVDNDLFNPAQRIELSYNKPIMLYVGRIAPEKNLESFLDLDIEGTKVLVGNGPSYNELSDKYTEAVFLGAKQGTPLANLYAAADVFVFPSLTDTFGVVNIEAIASGTPVAAYPVTGPKDIITDGVNGCLHQDLKQAIESALKIDRQNISQSIPEYTWQGAAQQFLSHLAPIKKTPHAK